ncbi:hypothetical protein CBR_g23391 [Chara braunii]|uniref:Integrase catalytic domain-containing protein n=1 Tax=Chara braunii TaxID=69332 RepID=A0A388L430_CHABU|nr:hypothetical protein CBR_g23391 [Chara braunii]|eukprot:GBG77065.1 hypothetical protein CBR_g23391 [Chara braunii]
MTILTRSQTATMDQKAGETDEAYEARLAAILADTKQQADAAAAARKKKEAEAERLRLLAEEQRQKHEAAAARADDEERVRRREIIFREESALHAQAKDWQKEAENGDPVDVGSRVSQLLNRVTDLLATCIAQQEDIYSLDHANKALQQSSDRMLKRIQQLEQQVANANANVGPSDLVDRVNGLEIDVGTLKAGAQQHVCAAASSSTAPRETIVKFDGLPIFCDASKTDPIQWWRQFELKLDLHHVANKNRHAYLYSCSGGACQAWLDNMLSAHACTVTDLHKYITWADLTAAWKKRFQVEPPEHKAMDKLLTFLQNSMPSGDWISEFQRLASTPKLLLNFDGIKLYFIKRSCPALQNALTHVADTLTTSEELFNKAAQIIVTNLAARNTGPSSNAGQGAHQHRPKVVVVAAATTSDPSTSNEAVSSDEGDRLAAAQNGGRPAKGRGRCKPKTNTNTSSGPGQAAPAQGPWTALLEDRGSLNQASMRGRPFDFGTDARESFLALKAALLSAKVLRIYDPLLPTRVTTDASGYGIGAVLEQHDGVDWHPAEYFNMKVPAVHSIDDARKKELLAFVHTLKRWRHFLLGRRQFRWVTDNNPLVFYKSQDTVNNTIARWMAFIDQFDFFPDHIPGKSNRFADALSRRPDHCTAVYSTFEIEDDLRDSFIRGYQADPEFRDKEAIAMDITGPFPKHKTGVDGILTVVDRLTKFAMFLPCRYHAKAPELAEILYAGWIRTKGYPKEIVCGRDTQFMSDFWSALIKRWGSSLKPSSARHPQTDGQMERAHQTAQVLLRTLIRPDQKDWVEQLPDVELAYNSSIHPAIGISPFEFEHGSPVNSPLDTILPRTAESDDHLLFIRRMQELLVKARDQMAKTQQRMRQQANRQRLPCPFRVGDLVWVSAAEISLEQDISRKLLPKWGPGRSRHPLGTHPKDLRSSLSPFHHIVDPWCTAHCSPEHASLTKPMIDETMLLDDKQRLRTMEELNQVGTMAEVAYLENSRAREEAKTEAQNHDQENGTDGMVYTEGEVESTKLDSTATLLKWKARTEESSETEHNEQGEQGSKQVQSKGTKATSESQQMQGDQDQEMESEKGGSGALNPFEEPMEVSQQADSGQAPLCEQEMGEATGQDDGDTGKGEESFEVGPANSATKPKRGRERGDGEEGEDSDGNSSEDGWEDAEDEEEEEPETLERWVKCVHALEWERQVACEVQNEGYSKQFEWPKTYQPNATKRSEHKRKPQQEVQQTDKQGQSQASTREERGDEELMEDARRQAAILEAHINVLKDQNRELGEDTTNLDKIAYAPHKEIEASTKRYARNSLKRKVILPFRWNEDHMDWEVTIHQLLALVTVEEANCSGQSLKGIISEDLPAHAYVIGDWKQEKEDYADTAGTTQAADYNTIMFRLQEMAKLSEGLTWMPWKVVETIPYGLLEDLPAHAYVIWDWKQEKEDSADTAGTAQAADYKAIMFRLQEMAKLSEGLTWMPWQVVETIPYGLLGGLVAAEWVARSAAIVVKVDVVKVDAFSWKPEYIQKRIARGATRLDLLTLPNVKQERRRMTPPNAG